jgi:hypothetical protein
MTAIEILGRVNEEGQLEFEQPARLPPGEVRITIEPFDIAADEALWDEQFAKSQDVLDQLSQEAHEDYLAGRTEDCDDSDAV